MEGLQQLTDSVLQKVIATGESNLDLAKLEAENELIAHRAKLSDQRANAEARIRQESASELGRQKTRLANQRRNESLRLRRSLLQGILTDAETKLAEMPAGDFLEFIYRALEAVGSQDAIEISFGKAMSTVLSTDLLDQVKAKYPNVEFAHESVADKAGFLLSSEGINYNYFFDELIKDLSNDLLLQLSNRLSN